MLKIIGFILLGLATGIPVFADNLVESVSGNYVVRYELNPAQLKVGAAKIAFEILDLDTENVSRFSAVSAKLFMPSMGHGSKPVKVEGPTDKGLFEITGSYFMMGGLWEILIDAKDAQGRVESFKIPVIVTR